MNRTILFAAVGMLSLSFATGCASKQHVRNETAPIINKVNELDELTAKNTNAIRDVDARAQKGIQGVNEKAAAADQKAMSAGQSADQAQQAATQASNRVSSLANTVANLDNYHPVVETSVHFGFDKSDLTSKAKKALDQLGSEIGNTKSYIVVIDGNTDSVGPADSVRRKCEPDAQGLAAGGPFHRRIRPVRDGHGRLRGRPVAGGAYVRVRGNQRRLPRPLCSL